MNQVAIPDTATKAQAATIDALVSAMFRCFCYGRPEDYEFKELELKEYSGFISLWMVVGNKNDENKLTSILCRETAHLFIDRKGNIAAITRRNARKTFGKRFHDAVWFRTMEKIRGHQQVDRLRAQAAAMKKPEVV